MLLRELQWWCLRRGGLARIEEARTRAAAVPVATAAYRVRETAVACTRDPPAHMRIRTRQSAVLRRTFRAVTTNGDDDDDDIPPARQTTVSKYDQGSDNRGSGGVTEARRPRETKEYREDGNARKDQGRDD